MNPHDVAVFLIIIGSAALVLGAAGAAGVRIGLYLGNSAYRRARRLHYSRHDRGERRAMRREERRIRRTRELSTADFEELDEV